MDPAFYERSTLTPEEADAHDQVTGALADAVRALADAQLRTLVDHDELAEVTKEIEELTARLLTSARPGALGTELGPRPREVRNPGNTVVGRRNPFAAVLPGARRVTEDKHVVFSVELGALYEGPPGFVHGGVSALLLDQVLGEAAAVGGAPGMTGRLTVHYRRPTPLGPLTVEGWLASHEGRTSVCRGQITDPDGQMTVEAEGLFVLPAWAIDHPAWDRSFE